MTSTSALDPLIQLARVAVRPASAMDTGDVASLYERPLQVALDVGTKVAVGTLAPAGVDAGRGSRVRAEASRAGESMDVSDFQSDYHRKDEPDARDRHEKFDLASGSKDSLHLLPEGIDFLVHSVELRKQAPRREGRILRELLDGIAHELSSLTGQQGYP